MATIERPRSETSAASRLTFRKVTGTLGAEVSGCDLSAELTPELIATLSAAMVEYKVLFFRDQVISSAQQLAFGRCFGPLEVHPFAEGSALIENSGAETEIIIVESTAERPNAACMWHSDVTWRVDPSLCSILRATIVPEYGGDTLWADMSAVFEGLDDATRSRLSGMTASHDWHHFRAGMRKKTSADQIARLEAEYPPAHHPIVRTHPVSGEKILFVNPAFTIGIDGMGGEESRTLLSRLYAETGRPEYQVRFSWQPNSIALWDNRSTQHYGVPDFYPQHRRMERVTVAGDKPF